jgi:hypothetical protein
MRASKLKLKINQKVNEFLNKNHLQKSSNYSVAYSLHDSNDEMIMVMTFGKARFSKCYQWELLRLCTKKGEQVQGGASRLLKHFIEDYKPESIVSYCHTNYFSGDVYNKLGFVKTRHSSGLKFVNDKGEVKQRQQAWHKNQQKWNKFYDPNLTQIENMKKAGYHTELKEGATDTYVIITKPNWEPGEIFIYRLIYYDGKSYVGQHKRNPLEDGYTGSGIIARRKSNLLSTEVLTTCNKEDAAKVESYFIFREMLTGNCINLTLTTVSSYHKDTFYSEEQRELISLRFKKMWSDPEFRKRYSEQRKKMGVTENMRKAWDAKKGKSPNNEESLRKYFSDSNNRLKTSEATKKGMKSEEVRNKISEGLKKHYKEFGYTPHIPTDEEKKRISETLKERFAKFGSPNKGRKLPPQSEETKRKRRETMKGKHWKLVNGKRTYY